MHISLFSFVDRPIPDELLYEETLQAQANQASGLANYTRQDFLDALAAGMGLEIEVVGVCSIASDVSADLINEAVRSFKLRGKLIASPEVKDALMRKKA